MASLFEMTKEIKKKIDDPRNSLLNNNICPLIFSREEVQFQTKLSRFLLIIQTKNFMIHLSTVFNENIEQDILSNKYNKIKAKRCLEGIYYDLEIE